MIESVSWRVSSDVHSSRLYIDASLEYIEDVLEYVDVASSENIEDVLDRVESLDRLLKVSEASSSKPSLSVTDTDGVSWASDCDEYCT